MSWEILLLCIGSFFVGGLLHGAKPFGIHCVPRPRLQACWEGSNSLVASREYGNIIPM